MRMPRFARKLYVKALTRIGNSFLWALSGVRNSFHQTFQQGIAQNDKDSMLRFSPVFACLTGISSDIAKLRIKLCKTVDGIWEEITANQPWLPVLRKPNHYQNRIQFIEQWILSKLLSGNTYVLKERDQRGIVRALYILDPTRVSVLQADNGDVYYELRKDPLSRQMQETIVVPASAIIHDRWNCLFHPLIGVSPLHACAMSATLGDKIQSNSTYFFENRALPGGVITIEGQGKINQDQIDRLEKKFTEQFSGKNIGNVWVLANGMKFNPITMTAEAAQLAEQLKWTVDDIARAFHYPAFKLGAQLPPYSGVEALITTYYTDCLQILIESMEICLDEGLELPAAYGTELDLDNLMRMDTAALVKSISDAIGCGAMAPNEGRLRMNLKPVAGGKSPYLQQQNYSLEALAKRDAQEDPFDAGKQSPPAAPKEKELSQEEMEALYESEWRKEVA